MKPEQFQMMIPPWMLPHQPRPEYHGNDVPARVQVALKLLADLTEKTATDCAVNDVSMSEIAGQELLPVEHQAQAAALHMLIDYFHGKLDLAQWEHQHAGVVAVIGCPECQGVKKNCALCQGAGKMGMSRLP